MKAVYFLVMGRVQGVGFRMFAERRASELNVVGYVRNLPEGHVGVFAQGETEALERYREWLLAGPSFARVEDVSVEDVPVDPNLRDFRVRY
ncbi:MAG: acylphosphatase [Vicinamibacteria bacterium]